MQRENERLKEVVAHLSVENLVLNKPRLEPMGPPYLRRQARVKPEVLQLVERSPLPLSQTLKELQIAPSNYYRWRGKYAVEGLAGLADRPSVLQRMWNTLKREDREYVVRYALEHLSLSPREVATGLVDVEGRFVSESTVYRLLKKAGLIKAPRVKSFPAGKEYHTKTTRRNQLWQTDASYFFVSGWGITI